MLQTVQVQSTKSGLCLLTLHLLSAHWHPEPGRTEDFMLCSITTKAFARKRQPGSTCHVDRWSMKAIKNAEHQCINRVTILGWQTLQHMYSQGICHELLDSMLSYKAYNMQQLVTSQLHKAIGYQQDYKTCSMCLTLQIATKIANRNSPETLRSTMNKNYF